MATEGDPTILGRASAQNLEWNGCEKYPNEGLHDNHLLMRVCVCVTVQVVGTYINFFPSPISNVFLSTLSREYLMT